MQVPVRSHRMKSLTSLSEAPELPMFLDGGTHPVNLGVASDGSVVDVDHDDLEVLVGRVLADPVGIEHPQALQPAAHSLLRYGLGNI